MGMDGVEITMTLEDRFPISFDDDEVIYLYTTPARIEWLVIEKLAGRKPAVVDISALMGWILETLKSLPIRRKLWRSTWSFELAFPPEQRRDLWERFGNELGFQLPSLELASSAKPRIPHHVSDCWKLAVWVLDHHPDRCPLLRDGSPVARLGTGLWLDDDVSTRVVEVICHCLGVKPVEITPDILLRDDLGMD